MNQDSTGARHPHADELQLYILGRLSPAEVRAVDGHILGCDDCRQRLETAAQLMAKFLSASQDQDESGRSERRSEPRFSAPEIAEALGIAPAVPLLRSFSPLLPERWPVQIVDVSKNGLGLIVPTQLSPGSLVQIKIGSRFILGEVRHSTPINDREFRIGVRLHDIWWWRR